MHASSESGLLCSSSGASASGRLWIGQTVWPVFASCRTMWRWLNVPRSVSCPVRRIGVPSVKSDANASASACAQSIPPASPSASRRRSSCLTSFGCTVKPSGTLSSSSPILRRGGGDLPLQPLVQQREFVPDLLRLAVDLLLGDDAFGDEAVGPQFGDALLALDLRVHLRLRVGRLGRLLVGAAAVAE